MQLRPYEEQAVRDLSRLFQDHKRILGVAPTGSGKTVIATSLIAEKWPKKRGLWLAHRVELIRQAKSHLRRAGVASHEIGILTGPEKENEGARILVASVDTIRRRDLPADIDFIIVDEAHRAVVESYRTIIDGCKDALILGLTATPWRLDGTPMRDVFQAMLVMAETVDLIDKGFLAVPICYGIPEEKARALTRGINGVKEFNSGTLGHAMSRRPLLGDVISEWRRLAEGLPTIVFAVNHEHAEGLYLRFKEAKVKVEYLRDGIKDTDRETVLKNLSSGKTTVVVNVDMLSEGYDCPNVECVVLARPTKSLTRFLQQCGRGARPTGKQIILDHAGNCYRFNTPEAPRLWSLSTRAPTGSEVGRQAPTKVCVAEDCRSYMPAGCRECPECGAEQPYTERTEARRLELERIVYNKKQSARIRDVLDKIAASRAVPKGFNETVLRRLGVRA